MKKILLTIVLFTFLGGLAFAQNDKEKKAATNKRVPKKDQKDNRDSQRAAKEADYKMQKNHSGKIQKATTASN